MKAVAYYRVSTAAQGRSGLGLEAQKTVVADFARQREMTMLAEFAEVESRKRNDRPVIVDRISKGLGLVWERGVFELTGAVRILANVAGHS